MYKIRLIISIFFIITFANNVLADQIKIWYGTNRQPVSPYNNNLGFSNALASQINYGYCSIDVPSNHVVGNNGKGGVWEHILGLDLHDDQFDIKRTYLFGNSDTFYYKLNQQLDQKPPYEQIITVFIHGYNAKFVEVAAQTAQLAVDTKIPGEFVFYSWPSSGDFTEYQYDKEMMESSIWALESFLYNLRQNTHAKQIHIITHSMGGKAFLKALQLLQSKHPQATNIFDQIVLTAPDISVPDYINLAPYALRLGKRTTVYTSPTDKIVKLSKFINKTPRVGLTPPVTTFQYVDTIEVNYSPTSLADFSHGYVSSSIYVLHDIQRVIWLEQPVYERPYLSPQFSDNNQRYWKLQGESRSIFQPFSCR